MNTESINTDVTTSVRQIGVGIWPNFITHDLLPNLRTQIDHLRNSEYALRFPKSTRVWDLYRHGDVFLDLLTKPALKCALLELLGEGYLLSDYSLNIVNPAQPIDDWHIDYPYNEMTHPVTGSALLGVQCVLAIDEFTAENGATQYIPLSREPSRVPNASTEHPYEQLEAVAGTLTIMAASTWHRSGYNASSLPRSAVLLSFVERWIRPMNDPPEPGPWSTSQELRMLLGLERPAETINGVAINGGTEL